MARGLPAEASAQAGHESGPLLPVGERHDPADDGARG
jgi:hypothetical protein